METRQGEAILKTPIDIAFTSYTGIEPITGTDVEALRVRTRDVAAGFLTALVTAGRLTSSEEEAALATWSNLIALDEEGLAQFADFQAQPYRQNKKELEEIIERLTAFDPEKVVAQKQVLEDLISSLDAIIDSREQGYTDSLAVTNRLNLGQPDRVTHATQVGMPDKLIIVNWSRKEEIAGAKLKGLVLEETAHLVSKLERYNTVDTPIENWVYEMMARVIAFETGYGHSPQDPDYTEIRRDLRADDYLSLYRMTNILAGGDSETLLKMFFGTESPGSEALARVMSVLSRMNRIGRLVNTGISLKDIFGGTNSDQTPKQR